MKELSTNLQSFSESLYKKMVLNKRGGWCHELNALMYWALKELGFNIKITDGIGWDMLNQKWTSSMEHMVMVVTFDNKNYMLDVGLGLVAVWVEHKAHPTTSFCTC